MRVVDGAERDAEVVGVAEVAAADEGDVFGDAQAGLEGGLDGADGGEVVVAEDGVGARVEAAGAPAWPESRRCRRSLRSARVGDVVFGHGDAVSARALR